jgi:hypothetical protein
LLFRINFFNKLFTGKKFVLPSAEGRFDGEELENGKIELHEGRKRPKKTKLPKDRVMETMHELWKSKSKEKKSIGKIKFRKQNRT